MNDVIELPRRESAGIVAGEAHRHSALEIRERVNLVQEVMRAVMKEGVHYGKIPGTPKPTLYKAGAEVLCVAFRIAPSYRVEELSSDGVVRFRVACVGTHQISNITLGEAYGECSSGEEKYKWRAAICVEEFDMFPESMRRLKFSKYQGKVEKKTQVRTESADQANTVLKMACKRAKIAMTLDVTAASDMFTQDIEDLPEELRQQHEVSEPVLSDLATALINAANACVDDAALTRVWQDGVSKINEAKDVTASNAFKAAVTARGAALKATAAAAKPAPISDAMAGLLADMESAADGGPDALEQAWGSLSKATQASLAPHRDALNARAAAVAS